MMCDEDTGKTVLGENWPLEERLLDKNALIESYINCGKMSDAKVGLTLGQDATFYYIVWYMLEEEKVILHKTSKDAFDAKFPSEQDQREMRKHLPEFPPQPVGLANRYLNKIVKDRNIVRY